MTRRLSRCSCALSEVRTKPAVYSRGSKSAWSTRLSALKVLYLALCAGGVAGVGSGRGTGAHGTSAAHYFDNDATESSGSSKVAGTRVDRSLERENLRPIDSRLQREQLYEAYNLLHTLAQDFHKPFDAPAVLVVGHQTSGKSALIEALMGFQFNQVGGGTKTRRPIALRMQYNPRCTQPMCFLTLENGKEEPRTLSDLQAYIESENRRLERDPVRCFDSREIMIRMEYRFCPNMIVIDTPGLLNAPTKSRHLNAQQRALVQAAREAENLVLAKMRCPDYIILCVEDTTDWKHATTRNIVMQVDPELSRTVLVTTKLDTKIPQFGEAGDLDEFLRAPLLRRLYPHMLGGPYFTSVPCGRVGSTSSHALRSNEAFVRALQAAERQDRAHIASKLGGLPSLRQISARVGLARLRSFLEKRVEECYRRNVAKIVPLLQAELRNAQLKLMSTDAELAALSVERLKRTANIYREQFVKSLYDTIQGTIAAPPAKFGETLEVEQLNGGSFLDQDQIRTEQWQRLLETEVGNSQHKVFGGAQYHRALREFAVAVRHMQGPEVSEDEIANAAGVGDMHDGVNFMRAACVIAVEKARVSFEPMLETLRHRSVYIMKRLYEVVEFMLAKNGDQLTEAHTKPFQQVVRKIYGKFAEEIIESCISRCKDDLKALTRFVTWDLNERSAGALQRSLPQPKNLVQVYSVGVDSRTFKSLNREKTARHKSGSSVDTDSKTNRIFDQWEQANTGDRSLETQASTYTTPGPYANEIEQMSDYYDLLQFMEEIACQRDANRTSVVVSALVQHVIRGWRDHFARTVAMKFNCFFLMPFIDEFPFYLRNELDKVYEGGYGVDGTTGGGVGELFDITEARQALHQRKQELLHECDANQKLQRRFDMINAQLRMSRNSNTAPANTDEEEDDEMYDYVYPPSAQRSTESNHEERPDSRDFDNLDSEALTFMPQPSPPDSAYPPVDTWVDERRVEDAQDVEDIMSELEGRVGLSSPRGGAFRNHTDTHTEPDASDQ